MATAAAPDLPQAQSEHTAAAEAPANEPQTSQVSDEQLAAAEKNYKLLKRKLKYLLYEQESLADDLRKCRRKVLRITKEKEFLLDRLLRHEDVPTSEDEGSSASEAESDDLPLLRTAMAKKLEQDRAAAKKASLGAGKDGGKKRKKKKDGGQDNESPVKDDEDEHEGDHHGGSRKHAESKKQEMRCRAQPCKMKPLTNLKYCRKHAPLDPKSGLIYCTYRDPETKAQTCKQVIRRDMSKLLCPNHRRTRLETASPTTAVAPSPAPGTTSSTPTPSKSSSGGGGGGAAGGGGSDGNAAGAASGPSAAVADKSVDELATPSQDAGAMDDDEDDEDDED